MKTMIQGGYVVGFDGKGHTIIRDGVVVFEDDKIIHVGKSFGGGVDRTIDANGKLVSPGFINIHAGCGVNPSSTLDGMRAGRNVSKAYIVDGIGNLELSGEDLKISVLLGVVSLIKGGATTSVPIGTMATSRWETPIEWAETVAKTAGELGARAYVSHQYRSGAKYWTEDGVMHYHWNEEAGRAALERGLGFCKGFEGSYDDRIRTMLFPYQFENCSTRLLQETRKAADEHNIIIHMHTSQYLSEFHEILRRYGKTPVQYLYDIEFLDPKVILTHVIYTTLNPVTGYPEGDTQDIELLAESGATVAHCPVVFCRAGIFLHSFGLHLKMGVNIAIAIEAFPLDMIKAMRYAAILGKIAEGARLAVTARDVFNAATLNGAKALGRDDLGRLAPGAKADIVIVDLPPAADHPIKSLVYMTSQQDIKTVIVDGKVLVEGGRMLDVDEEELASKASEVTRRQKMAVVDQNPMGLSADEFFPPSFPME